MPAGQPTKFKPEYKEMLMHVKTLLDKGVTDAALAQVLDVTTATINNWKKAHPEFFASLNETKYVADEKVKDSLFQKALGFTQVEEKVDYDAEGNVKGSTKITKKLPPDSTACIFWLKNRIPDEWRDVQIQKRESTEEEIDLLETAKKLAYVLTQATPTIQ